VFVLPSDYEAFGIVLLEAMAARTPVVASRVGGVPDVVEDGVTGLLYPYGNLDALATALDGLLGDAAERARMGERGRERVERLFTWDSVVDRLLGLYAELIDDR